MKILKFPLAALIVMPYLICSTFAYSSLKFGNRDKDLINTKPGRIPIVKEPNPCKTFNPNTTQPTDQPASSKNAKKPQLKVYKPGEPRPEELEKLDPEDQFVSVFVSPAMGPVGQAYIRNDFNTYVKLPEKNGRVPFVYPSIYFDISASPKLMAVSSDPENIYALNDVKNQKKEMMWMDLTVELFPYCKSKDGKTLEPCTGCKLEDQSFCGEPLLRVLSILPSETVSGTRDSLPVQLSGAASELATLALPYYASSAFGTRSESATKGVSVLFNNLFPPKPFTYQHAYFDSPTRFGWNFHNRSRLKDSTAASIMGLHKTAAILQVREDVQMIGIRYYSLSEWNKPPNTFNKKFDLRTDGSCLSIPKTQEEKIKYEKLTNLDNFPLLVPSDEACKILQIESTDEACKASLSSLFQSKSDLLNNGKHVKKSALEKLMGIEKFKKNESETTPLAPTSPTPPPVIN